MIEWRFLLGRLTGRRPIDSIVEADNPHFFTFLGGNLEFLDLCLWALVGNEPFGLWVAWALGCLGFGLLGLWAAWALGYLGFGHWAIGLLGLLVSLNFWPVGLQVLFKFCLEWPRMAGMARNGPEWPEMARNGPECFFLFLFA